MLDGYLGYWSAIETLDDIPAGERVAALRPYAVDPALSRALKGFSDLDRKNQKFYGKEVHHPTVASLSATEATVKDCTDTSQYGLMDKTTGKKLNRGTPASQTEVSLQRSAAGVWQVAQVNIATGAC